VITADAGVRFKCTYGIGRKRCHDAGAPRERLAGGRTGPKGLCAADSKSFFSRNGRLHCALRKILASMSVRDRPRQNISPECVSAPTPIAANCCTAGLRRSGPAVHLAWGNRRNHQHDLFDAARGLFDQVGDGLGIGDIDSVAARHLNNGGAGPFRHELLGRIRDHFVVADLEIPTGFRLPSRQAADWRSAY
jgi:hypothetical protein